MEQTKKYYKEDHIQVNYKRLTMASCWVCPVTGEVVKLSHNLKAVYHHKLEQYKSFKSKDLPYHESHQTVADKLSLTVYTVKKVIIPLLKRMGLIHLEKINTRRYITTMYDLKYLQGKLVNEKLSKHHKKKANQYKDQQPLTYEQLLIINANKEKIRKIQGNLKEAVVVLKKEDFDNLMQSRRDETKEA